VPDAVGASRPLAGAFMPPSGRPCRGGPAGDDRAADLSSITDGLNEFRGEAMFEGDVIAE
jgi:hypothetical protein